MSLRRVLVAAGAVVVFGLSLDGACGQVFGYGMDPVPMSNFHHGEWRFYGSDPVPAATPTHREIRTGYGHDPVPNTVGPHHDPADHVLINQVIEHLTGAVEIEPAPATKTAAPRPSSPTSTDCRCRCR